MTEQPDQPVTPDPPPWPPVPIDWEANLLPGQVEVWVHDWDNSTCDTPHGIYEPGLCGHGTKVHTEWYPPEVPC